MRIAAVWLAMISLILGCSRPQQPQTEDAEAARVAPLTAEDARAVPLTAERESANAGWIIADRSAEDLEIPLPDSEAHLEVIEDGVRATTFDRRGRAHVIYRQNFRFEWILADDGDPAISWRCAECQFPQCANSRRSLTRRPCCLWARIRPREFNRACWHKPPHRYPPTHASSS